MLKELIENKNLTIKGSSITDLGLRGNELIIYSLLDDYTYARMNDFELWTGCTRQGIHKMITKLIAKGLIKKVVEEDKAGKPVYYLKQQHSNGVN